MLGTVAELEHELAERKLRTRAFVSVNSNTSWGDRPFSRGHLYRILSNPIYVGKIVHNGKQYDGRHEAIIDLKTFSAVQARLASNNRQHKTRSRAKEPSLLAGLLVDAQGAKFVASHAVKDGKRYRYYVGSRVEQGEPKPWRLPAHAVEAAVISELRRLLGDQQCVAMALASLRLKTNEMKEALWTAQQLQAQITTPAPHHETIAKLIKQIRVSESELTLEINLAAIVPGRATPRNKAYQVRVPIELTRRNGETALVIVADKRDHQAEPDSALIKAIARGFTWFEELATGRSATVTAIAARERVSDRYVSQMIELAFLSPRIIEATLTGTRVAQISTKNLVFDIEIPSAWSEQENAFYARNRFGYLWSVGNGDSPSSFKNVLCFAVDS
ncbi:recombinase family protein [Pseudorhodoplanes sp.]|uniref:recombinase family protein n=1 Tax=Pseudorhodoplanes sp. TaxID=1934341 RepID=UPI003D12B561